MMITSCYVFFLSVLLMVAVIRGQPDWWNDRVNQGVLLSTDEEPTSSLMATVGNGYVSYVIGGSSIYVGAVFNGPALSLSTPSHRAEIPNYQNIVVGGKDAIFQYSGLDIENATYTRVYSFSSSPSTTVSQVYYASQTIRNVLVQEITIDNSQGSDDFELSLSLPINTTSSPDLNIQQIYNDQFVTQYNACILKAEVSFITCLAITTTTLPSSIRVAAGQVDTFYYLTSFYTNLESANEYTQESAAVYKQAFQEYDSLLEQHKQAWQIIWQSRIEIGGNLELAQVVNSSLYYIVSAIRQDWPWSISPGSLAYGGTGTGYNGHAFWDAETWMYPPVLILNPQLAGDAILQYRFNHYQGAVQKAQSYVPSYQGVMYPWESAFSGIEVCPTFAPTGLLEQHITGDVSFATRQYYYVTGDTEWLSNNAFTSIKAMAQFWASRVLYDQETQQYVINGVIPPDEYAVGVNNSVYTNIIAKMSLEWAIEAATILGINDTIPLEQWQSIIHNIKIPFDPVNQRHPEYDGYNGQQIKQADVILLGFPLMYNMTKEVRENDLTYYEGVTDPQGPAMTHSMFTVGWLELGNLSKASDEWSLAYANAQQPFKVWTETPTGGTVNFITGAGGFLQAVIFGYGGLRIHQGSYQFFAPLLPPNTTSIKLNGIYYLNATFNMFWDDSIIEIELTSNPNNIDFYLTIGDDNNSLLQLYEPIQFNNGNFVIQPTYTY